MKKGTKIVLISSAVVLGAGGLLVATNPKLRVKLGLPVKYTSSSNGQTYEIKYSKYGSNIVLSAMKDGNIAYFITLDEGKLNSNQIVDGATVKQEITNPDDVKYFSKFF